MEKKKLNERERELRQQLIKEYWSKVLLIPCTSIYLPLMQITLNVWLKFINVKFAHVVYRLITAQY